MRFNSRPKAQGADGESPSPREEEDAGRCSQLHSEAFCSVQALHELADAHPPWEGNLVD